MKVRVKNRPSGAYNGKAWPAVGKTIDLPEHVAEGMIASGTVEKVQGRTVESRPASDTAVETTASNTGRKRKG